MKVLRWLLLLLFCLSVSQAQVSGNGGVTGNLGGTPGGTSGQVQYNSSGAFSGSSAFLFNGTSTVTLGPAAANGVLTVPAATNANGNSLTFTATNGNGTSKNGGGFVFNLGQLTAGGQSGTLTINESPTTQVLFNDINGDGSTGGLTMNTSANASSTNISLLICETNTNDCFEGGAVPTNYSAGAYTIGNSSTTIAGPFQYLGCVTNLTCYLMGGAGGTAAIAGFTGGTLVGTWYTKQIFGKAGIFTGNVALAGTTSGEVDILPQAAAGSYNFNLPTTAGSAGQVLTSQGGGSTAMTWTTLPPTTAPTISSGFGTGPSITANAGPQSFSVNVGTGGTASSGVVGLPTASHGWACSAADVTTPTSNLTQQTASSTTTATFTNYVRTTGIAGAWTASDIVQISCWAN